MTSRTPHNVALLAGVGALFPLALVLAGCVAQRQQLPDRFAVGRDAGGYRCTAVRDWEDKALSPFDAAYSLSCGGVTASRAQGIITAVPVARRAAEPEGTCGTAVPTTIGALGEVQVQRCFDAKLGASAVVVRVERNGISYRGAAVGPAVGPMERALVTLATGELSDADQADAGTAIKPDALPTPQAGPAGAAAAAAESGFNPALALREGIALNRQGLFIDASRVLNAALVRQSEMPVSANIELLLEAGLADSNIGFPDAARSHFVRAATLLERPAIDRGDFLRTKANTYAMLDLLNQGRFDTVIAAPVVTTAAQPGPDQAAPTLDTVLHSPSVLARLNQPGARGGSGLETVMVNEGVPESIQLRLLTVQRAWARGVAQLASKKGSADLARAELARASAELARLIQDDKIRLDPAPLVYLVAQIERQSGRVDERNKRFDTAVNRFDCALAALNGLRPAKEELCAVPLNDWGRARLVAATVRTITPVLAETQIERASIDNKMGTGRPAVLASFSEGVTTLIASGRSGSVAPAGLDTYLELLAAAYKDNRDPALPEDYFRAIQAVGEPAIARQLSALRTIVSADNVNSPLLRERNDLMREIPALRYQIDELATPPAGMDPAVAADRRAKLRVRYGECEQRLQVVNDKLLSSGALSAVDDSPATVEELQKTLGDDELYFKLSEVRGRLFAIVIGKKDVEIYQVGRDLRTVTRLVERLRVSIRDGSGVVPQFRPAAAYSLFELLAGPAQKKLHDAGKIVFDPAGPMSSMPLGVLVTERAGVERYLAAVKQAPKDRDTVYDYSGLAFVARNSEIGTALSPRSFLDARRLPESKAPPALVGLGEHGAPVPAPDREVAFGGGCTLPRRTLVELATGTPAISATKITMVAEALGVPAERITGAAFTDLEVLRRGGAGANRGKGDLNQYQVLHFATHGMPEMQEGCTLPPRLLTTLGAEIGSDGFLSFDEVAQLQLDANLVVLAACETSASASARTGRLSGLEETGRSLDGLVRAFLAANARAVMATYWQVSIAGESDELFKTFYTHGRTQSIGASLLAAQSELIKKPRFSHPYYWGAYFVVGNTNRTMLTGR